MTGENLSVVQARPSAPALTFSEITQRVQLVRSVMKDLMRQGIHFGSIPGCGERKVLLQPGAELLSLTFQLAPSYETTDHDLPRDHVEIVARCTLSHIGTGAVVAQAVRSASTMESKYRFRAERVGDLPRDWFKLRQKDPGAAREMIGGDGFEPRKMDGTWSIVHLVEVSNPADHFNTVRGIATKRAFVAAIRAATAASDIFEQEDDPPSADDDRPRRRNTQPAPGRQAAPADDGDTPLERLRGLMEADGISEQDLFAYAQDRRVRRIPDNIQTLDELALSASAALVSLVSNWQSISAKIQTQKQENP